MVVTPHPLATEAGVEALRAGGTAVDAAVAANAMLAVVYCNACGLGGDAFALVWDRRGPALRLQRQRPLPRRADHRGRARGRHATMPDRGPLTINVPGAVDAWARSSTASAADPSPMHWRSRGALAEKGTR